MATNLLPFIFKVSDNFDCNGSRPRMTFKAYVDNDKFLLGCRSYRIDPFHLLARLQKKSINHVLIS